MAWNCRFKLLRLRLDATDRILERVCEKAERVAARMGGPRLAPQSSWVFPLVAFTMETQELNDPMAVAQEFDENHPAWLVLAMTGSRLC